MRIRTPAYILVRRRTNLNVSRYEFIDRLPFLCIGWLEKIIANEKNNVRLILLEFSQGNHSRIIEILPIKSIIINIYHYGTYFDLRQLVEYRTFHGLPRVGLVILNHEQPWISAFALTKDDYPYRNRFLNHVYGHFKFVLRNYYFSPLKQSSLFLPLGPMYLDQPLTTEHREVLSKGLLLRASARSILCSFHGRLMYSSDSVHHQNRFDLFKVSLLLYNSGLNFLCLIFGSQLGIDMNGSFPCLLEQVETGTSREANYTNNFVFYMTNSIFVLCPFGNSPETFRHYEAFEYGSIPLIVRPSFQYDFISEMWGSDVRFFLCMIHYIIISLSGVILRYCSIQVQFLMTGIKLYPT
jgi:hypothetical protein